MISQDLLQINIFGGKSYFFKPDQVFSISKKNSFMSNGIQIHNNIREYPQLILFSGNPDKIASFIENVGFNPSAKGDFDQDIDFKISRNLYIIGLILIFIFAILSAISVLVKLWE